MPSLAVQYPTYVIKIHYLIIPVTGAPPKSAIPAVVGKPAKVLVQGTWVESCGPPDAHNVWGFPDMPQVYTSPGSALARVA